MPKSISSVTGFVRKVGDLTNLHGSGRILYRGHSDSAFDFVPSIFRRIGWRYNEDTMIRKLLAKHPGEFQNDLNTFDKLVRAQHYGLPTRLLDVTLNPLAALYFACSGNPSKRGQVIAAIPEQESMKFFDSDTVSCLSNLSYLTHDEKVQITEDLALDEEDGDLAWRSETEFNKLLEVDRLAQFIRSEKPYFRSEIKPVDLCNVVAVFPRKTHARILAQDGAFLLYGLIPNARPGGGFMEGVGIEKIDIAPDYKQKIISELNWLGVNRETLFPEIENAADQIRKEFG